MNRKQVWIVFSLLWAAIIGSLLVFLDSSHTSGAVKTIMRWRLEDWTQFLSFEVFVWIVYILTAILIVFLVVGCHTRMQRAWRSKVIAFNLIVWRSLLLTITHRAGVPQPWAIIFWLVTGYFVADFAIGFFQTWVAPLYGRHPRLRLVLLLLTLGLGVLSVYLAVLARMA